MIVQEALDIYKAEIEPHIQITQDGCWEYPEINNRRGRPVLFRRIDGELVTKVAHIAYMAFRGRIPAGMFLCHHCDNRACFNPDHLWVGTRQDNVDDMVRKGRQARGLRVAGAKLTDEQIRDIKTSKESGVALSKRYGVSQGYISDLRNGKKRTYMNVEVA